MRKLPLYLTISLFILSLILFYTAKDAGRVHDFTGFFINMGNADISEALGSFGYHVVQPFLQVFNYLLFEIGGRNSEVYYLVFHLLFALGIFGWAKYLYEISNAEVLVIFSLLAITINPYIVEVLVYKVSQAYLWTFVFLGWYHYICSKFLQNGRTRDFVILLILLLCQLWTFDYIIIYLPITFLIYWIDRNAYHEKYWLKLLALNFVVFLIYFLQNKLVLGNWVGHYGADVHMRMDIFGQLGTMLKYFFKQVFLGQFFTYTFRHNVYNMLATLIPVIVFLGLSFGALFLFLKKAKLSKNFRISLYFFLGSLITLLPVSNLSFLDLMTTENDRYGFLFAVFLTISIVAFILQLKSKILSWILIAIFLLVNVIAQGKLIKIWSENQKVLESSLSNWPDVFYQEDATVYLLNLPDNLAGSYLYKNLSSKSELFEETYTVQRTDTSFAEFKVVAQMNTNSVEEGARASRVSEDEFQVQLNQYGTWWWRNSLGITNYKNPDYKLTLNDLGYLLKMKREMPHIYIWNNGLWQKVD